MKKHNDYIHVEGLRLSHTSPRFTSIPIVSMSVPCLFWLRCVQRPWSCSVCILCLLCSKYDDNASKNKKQISNSGVYHNQVRMHNRRVHVRAVPVSGIIASVSPLLSTALAVIPFNTPFHTRCSPPTLLSKERLSLGLALTPHRLALPWLHP